MTDGGLSYDDALEIIERLSAAENPIVLIGGQAVNFWATRYQESVADLQPLAPFTSKDVDFFGHRNAVQEAARILGATLTLPGMDDSTPNTGVLTYTNKSGVEHRIDFLWNVQGLPDKDVTDLAVVVGNTGLTVLNAVLCVESRAANILTLPADYDTPQGHRQMAASIVCAREFLREMSSTNPRGALTYIERLSRFCTTANGLGIYAQGHDAFTAIQPLRTLPEKFITLRYPQLQERVQRARSGIEVRPSRHMPLVQRLSD